MDAIRARLAAIVASFLMARLATMGVADLAPAASTQIEQWVGNTFQLVVFLGYAIIHPWLRRKLEEKNPEAQEPK